MKPESSQSFSLHAMAHAAREAAKVLAEAKSGQKDSALVTAAVILRERSDEILAANARDMEAARAQGLDAAMLDRLRLDVARIEAMAAAMETVVTMPDPVHVVLDAWERPNGLLIQKISIPLGVLGIIYESRPNVTADAAALAIKSGNACILRAGSESLHSSQAIVACVQQALREAELPGEAVQAVPVQDRAVVSDMLSLVGLIDVIIPRGGKSLTRRVMEESRIPTILHLDGNCHVYIHTSADPAMAKQVLLNAKMRRVGVCGATESLVMDARAARAMLPTLAEALIHAGCALRGDALAQSLDARIAPASEEDWGTEYLAPVLSIKTVENEAEAIAHINRYGSHHTDAIIAQDKNAARRFLREVDSAIVLHNASTQFADGGEFGFGAEIGIATGRMPPRGPVGAEQLVTYKYVVHGDGQTRA